MQTFNRPAHLALSGLWRKIPIHCKLAFFTSLIGGTLVYLYALTNLLISTGDALIHVFSHSNQVWSGRWSSLWLCSISPPLTVPMINGVIGIIALSLLSAFTVDFLKIRSKPLVVFSALMIVCYPSVGDLLKYTYLFDGFMIAALCAVAGLWLTERFRFGWLAGIPLMVLSLGTYQVFISLVIALLFVRALWLLLFGQSENRDIVRFILRHAWFVFASLIGYYVFTRLYNHIFGITLLNYQSISSMGSMSLSRVFNSLTRCYTDFHTQIVTLSNRQDFFFPGYPNTLFIGLLVSLIAVGFLCCRKKTVLKTFALVLLLLLSPMLLCSIRLFGPDTVDVRMVISMVCLYLLGIMLLEHLPLLLERLETSNWPILRHLKNKAMFRLMLTVISGLMVICLILCLFAWTVGINIDFFNAKLDFENTYAQCAAYLSLAETTPGYEKHMPIYIIGSPEASETSSRKNPELRGPKYYYYFMFYFLDVDMAVGVANLINDDAWRLARTELFQSMPSYPANGCSAMVEGVLLIKLSDVH